MGQARRARGLARRDGRGRRLRRNWSVRHLWRTSARARFRGGGFGGVREAFVQPRACLLEIQALSRAISRVTTNRGGGASYLEARIKRRHPLVRGFSPNVIADTRENDGNQQCAHHGLPLGLVVLVRSSHSWAA